MIRLPLTRKESHAPLHAFCWGLAVAFLLFLPFIILDSGYFLYYGDFNVQQIPFYQMCHDAIRNGNVKWSWTTDLGASFVGSYSFYLLGSPFFWITIPFPSAAVPYLMGPLLILKFGCASFTGCVYLRRYVHVPEYAVLGGLLYAFSGFSVYNIFFNHFHEAIVFFPLLLWALDEYMQKRRRGVFALMVFACCFVNYYFFVGQVVFCLLYFFTRVLCGNWRLGVRDFLLLFCEAVIGLLASSVLLIPTVLCVVQNPRVTNPPEGWSALLYGYNQRYVHILQSLFFPPDIPARPNFTPNSEAKWASLGAWLPLFSMAGVIAYLRIREKNWLRRLLPLLFLMAFVPLLNSAFQMFNASYYARWFYMLTLMMSLATLRALEDAETDWKGGVLWTLGVTLGIALPIGLLPQSKQEGDQTVTVVGLEEYPTRLWTYVAITLLSLLLLVILLRYLPKHRVARARSVGLTPGGGRVIARRFGVMCLFGVAAVSLLYSYNIIALGKTQSDENHVHMIPYSLNQGRDLHLAGAENARTDVYEGMDNQCMFFQIPTIQAFHSIVPGSIMEFYPSVGVTRDVGSRPKAQYYGLRGLLSCRWLLDPIETGPNFSNKEGDASSPHMPGWVFRDTENGFDVWENQYYVPIGFAYDSYITRAEYDQSIKDDRHLLLMKAMVLDESQALRYGDVLRHYDMAKALYTKEAYYEDCLARREMACVDFSRDNDGFTAHTDYEASELVFFSVPYEGGWSATVNGAPVQIEKVNVGFMAVRVPAGKSEIRFTYRTPGLALGAGVSACAALLFAGYLFFTRRKDRAAPPPSRRVYHIKARRYLRVRRAVPGEITDAEDAFPS